MQNCVINFCNSFCQIDLNCARNVLSPKFERVAVKKKKHRSVNELFFKMQSNLVSKLFFKKNDHTNNFRKGKPPNFFNNALFNIFQIYFTIFQSSKMAKVLKISAPTIATSQKILSSN